MKTNLPCFLVSLVASIAAAVAAPLAVTTAVHTKPDASSPAINYLKAGTEPTAAPNTMASTPAGWMAVEMPGPFKVYVENKDLAKSLDPKPGTALRLAPKADAGVLGIAEKGDKISITGFRGKWTELTLEKNLIGYINVGGSAGYMPPIATTPATAAPKPAAPAPMSAAPVAPGIYGVATPGQPAAMVNLGDGGSATLPRQFAGKFVSTRRPLRPRLPYDYALNDDAGKRYAFLDISKLLLTEQIEKYVDHAVVVFGVAKAGPEGKDIVVEVETLQLK